MKTYCVVYRMGGTARFEWKRTFPKSRENAQKDLADIERMGYKAHVADFEQSLKIGLPETYE